jgi:hypothetical protein
LTVPRYVLDLACGHQRRFTYRKKPPFLEPTETAWSLAWCSDCHTQQKVTDVRQTDGSKSGVTSVQIDGSESGVTSVQIDGDDHG